MKVRESESQMYNDEPGFNKSPKRNQVFGAKLSTTNDLPKIVWELFPQIILFDLKYSLVQDFESNPLY
jgi:hypothetical protein